MKNTIKSTEFEVILFYKYVRIENPDSFMESQRELCRRLNLRGRILIAKEGINGTLEGTKENIVEYCEAIKADPLFSDIVFKRSIGNGKAFNKLMIKVLIILILMLITKYIFFSYNYGSSHSNFCMIPRK